MLKNISGEKVEAALTIIIILYYDFVLTQHHF